jgi:hypothetical protein
MVIELLSNKEEKYEDYENESFLKLLTTKFEIINRQPLKNDKRELFILLTKIPRVIFKLYPLIKVLFFCTYCVN